MESLARQIRAWGRELGFQDLGIAGIDLDAAEQRLLDWLAAGFHGEMAWMARHGTLRSRPASLVPGTVRVITARLDYHFDPAEDAWALLGDGHRGFVARYALGRDYHKLIRKRLQQLAGRIAAETGPFAYRAFADSAPVMEKPLAALAGLGWQGKHTNLLNREAGSWFFLGELYTDLPLPTDTPGEDHCGSCTRCIDICPTGAIVAPYQLDARRCIAYLTIEHPGAIPESYRRLIGNRVFGCDDCQLICPWNRYAQASAEADFRPRHGLEAPQLTALFAWDEATFLARTEGSPLRRLGHERWLRNIAVGLGNAPPDPAVTDALRSRRDHSSALVREHVEWALAEQDRKHTLQPVSE